ncbi:MAG: AsnC family protein, partial [Yaniella sp.]
MSEDQRSTEAAQLETIDWRIISALADDGRISITALAEKVHVSRAHCYSRLQHLQ